MSGVTQRFDTADYRLSVDVMVAVGKLMQFQFGAGAAPPLTRRERFWWAYQMLKHGEWHSAWAYVRYRAKERRA